MNEERELIASVFVNRLKLKILLQCDPTVIYALEKANRYHGPPDPRGPEVRFALQHICDTRVCLPDPSPIPDMRSLEAAMRPASTRYLYFVRTTGGRHTFSETLAAHNRAVAAYRAMTSGRSNLRAYRKAGFSGIP